MQQKIGSALLSVFYKDGLEPLVRQLHGQGATLYSTGGTQTFIEGLGVPVTPVESLTGYPSILGGRVKTLHPTVFGAILGKRDDATHLEEMQQYGIPAFDLVVVDLYPFEETLESTQSADYTGTPQEAEVSIIEKIDIGGPSMIRGAAKNFRHVTVIASKEDYAPLVEMLQAGDGHTTLEQRKAFAGKAFSVVAKYDAAIDNYFSTEVKTPLRYGENPHQSAAMLGDLSPIFTQLHGKEISYNNLVDVDAAIQLIQEFGDTTFAIIKHTNACGIASRGDVTESWHAALAGDPESAFGGVLVCNSAIDAATAEAISEIFFEVLIAPAFDEDALKILKAKKNRILLQLTGSSLPTQQTKSLLGGTLVQDTDGGNFSKWEEAGGRETSEIERADLTFANLVCKHLKSNAIALVKDRQLVGKGCGQTSRIDALRQAVAKAQHFGFDLSGAVMASDAFFPFADCVQLGHEAGITAFIQPGGSIRDKDSIEYSKQHGLAMVMTGQRHFRH